MLVERVFRVDATRKSTVGCAELGNSSVWDELWIIRGDRNGSRQPYCVDRSMIVYVFEVLF